MSADTYERVWISIRRAEMTGLFISIKHNLDQNKT